VTQVTVSGLQDLLHLFCKRMKTQKNNWFKFLLVCLGCLSIAALITWFIQLFNN
jgi:hypothetical protein